MFRLRALRRACQMHSFLFNPLAARPVQYGRGKAGCIYPIEQQFFSPLRCRAGSWLMPGKAGGRQASRSQL